MLRFALSCAMAARRTERRVAFWLGETACFRFKIVGFVYRAHQILREISAKRTTLGEFRKTLEGIKSKARQQ